MTMSLVQETAAAAYPQKLFYRIHEVAEIAGVKPHVLRYWETQFQRLDPEKDRSDQRRYRQADVDLILKIRALLYDEKFTIAGARKQIESERAARRKQSRHAASVEPLRAATESARATAEPVRAPAEPVRMLTEAPRRARRCDLAKIRAELCDLMQSLRA
jgi:DNA-binding transcriptional MerR regulator